ncbi:MAG: T9SS type A sorting domain-containing protein [Flavobacteriales bacterium]|nr:T9SS type A sorting domain-containing protein [Flavobacteriales bacterium]
MKLLYTFIAILLSQNVLATTWQVGPGQTYKFCSEVSAKVQHNDTVTIDFATYTNDKQVTWNKNNLLIIGVGGRPKLVAGDVIANDNSNGKGIFVVSGSNVRIENLEFTNAKVVDHNGAGIRQEGANLFVHRCKFDGNEMGILSGNISNCKTVVEYCEFINGGSPANPGYQHNIYINHIDTLIFRYNFSYNAIAQGHEFKSRANYNLILYNTISNYQTVDSRNIDIPNGGTTVVMGNIIEQGPNSANSNILGYGKEGLSNTANHELWVVNNTFVNKNTKGSFIDINPSAQKLFLKNNILAGAKTGGLIIGSPSAIDSSNNFITDIIANCGFENANANNYRLLSNSAAVDAGISISFTVMGLSLIPTKSYLDTCNVEARNTFDQIDIGAFEYTKTSSVSDVNSAKSWTLYPNPAIHFIRLNGIENQSEKIQLFNSNGILMKEMMVFENQNINIEDLSEGMYFLKSENDSFTTLKFVKL